LAYACSRIIYQLKSIISMLKQGVENGYAGNNAF
jgi:hypothetical protein